jgi:hypothetical protein
VIPSIETGPHSRGASSPRARRNPARRGAQPLSEAEPHPRGRPALERGEAFTSAAPPPLSEAEFRRGWPGRLSGGPRAREFILRVL